MSEAAEILVIILSVFLAFFLVLAIILVALLIRVAKQIRSVTKTAQVTADHVNEFVVGVTRLTSPALIVRMAMKHFNKKSKD